MRHRLHKPIALFMALCFTGGGATASLGVRACVHHAGAGETHDSHAPSAPAAVHVVATAVHAAEAPVPGQSGHHHASTDDAPGNDAEHQRGCSCLGQCLGSVAPPAPADAGTLRVQLATSVDRSSDLSDSESFRARPHFLLPYANAPPAVS